MAADSNDSSLFWYEMEYSGATVVEVLRFAERSVTPLLRKERKKLTRKYGKIRARGISEVLEAI